LSLPLPLPLSPHGIVKAMSNDMTNDVTSEETGDEVTGEAEANEFAGQQPPVSAADSAIAGSCDSPLRSGVGMAGVGVVATDTLTDIVRSKRPFVPSPPRPAAKPPPNSPPPLAKITPPAPTASRLAATAKPAPEVIPAVSAELAPGVGSARHAKPELRPSEKTLIFRPNLSDPMLRRSSAPTAPPPLGASSSQGPLVPRLPHVPEDLAARIQSGPVGESASDSRRQPDSPPNPEERTQAYSQETISKLLTGEHPTVRPPTTSAADDVTRVGEIPIEALISMQGKPSNKGVGPTDVTRVYDVPLGDPIPMLTIPGKRLHAEPSTEPLVIVQPEPRKSRWGWWVVLGLLGAATAIGWAYRGPIGQHAQKLQSTLAHGVGASRVGNRPSRSVGVPTVTVSIAVSPADARLLLDGAAMPNPCTVRRSSDKQLHSLVAEAPGYLPLRRNLRFERDLMVDLALASEPQAAVPTTSAKASVSAATAGPPPDSPAAAAATGAARVARKKIRVAPPPDVPVNNCNPPYTIDAAGIKSYRPECL
jgi:hypothetical protein